MQFYSVKEFAKRMEMHPQSIRKGIREGKFFAVKIGSGVRPRYRIPATELERLKIASMYKE